MYLGLRNLQCLTQITHLDLSGDNRIQKDGWQYLSNLTNIRKLGLEGTIISHTVLHSHLPKFLTLYTLTHPHHTHTSVLLAIDFTFTFTFTFLYELATILTNLK
jgi:hypothetical protein